MGTYSKVRLFVLLLSIGVLLLFSCAKKTTEPGSQSSFADLHSILQNCELRVYVYSDYNDYTETHRIAVTYRSRTPLDETPLLRVNDVTCIVEFDYEESWGGLYSYFGDFGYPAQLTPGQSFHIEITVNGQYSHTYLEMPYPVIIQDAPDIYNIALPMFFSWSLYKNANYQIIYCNPSIEEELPFDFYDSGEKLISGSAREFIIPANTIQSDVEQFSICIMGMNLKIANKTVFYALGLEGRQEYLLSVYMSKRTVMDRQNEKN